MASIKIKFRPSSVRGKEGVLFLQIIHRRVVRQIVTPYRLHAHEWDAFSQQVLLDVPSTQDPRWIHLVRIDTMIQSEYRLLCRIVTSFDQTSTHYSADSVVKETVHLLAQMPHKRKAFVLDFIRRFQEIP